MSRSRPFPGTEPTGEGVAFGGGLTSAINPNSMKSAVMQFIAGTSVNQSIDILMIHDPTALKVGPNTITLIGSGDGSVLWRDSLMPKSYRGGFWGITLDYNSDHTPDYIVVSQGKAPRIFFIDGRTGAVTRIAGSVSPGLRKGFVLQEGNIVGDGSLDFVSRPPGGAGTNLGGRSPGQARCVDIPAVGLRRDASQLGGFQRGRSSAGIRYRAGQHLVPGSGQIPRRPEREGDHDTGWPIEAPHDGRGRAGSTWDDSSYRSHPSESEIGLMDRLVRVGPRAWDHGVVSHRLFGVIRP